ncbi:ATP-binding cassette domain-containing protein [Azospirillum canadense]|uniref:ATP-binding cassette domain-containing protein n=1 Tax=Azospirillum canadense TaxID=403962 RepID=UPI002225DF33|nr:ATP-binding cassette domain-containing protein [Azospirillum canadense]MCW2241612.1 ATP-binding cassette subfamily C protein LapB [Azospirillum canadense]
MQARFPDHRFLRRLWTAVRAERPALLRLALLALPMQASALALPLLTGLVADRVVPAGDRALLALVCAGVALVAVQRAALDALRAAVLRDLEARLKGAVLRDVFARLMAAPLSSLRGSTVGATSQALASAEHIAGLTARVVLVPALDALVALAAVAGLVCVQPAFAPGLALWTLAVATLSWPLARRHAALERVELEASARHRGRLYELLRGAPTLLSAGRGEAGLGRWRFAFTAHQGAALERLRAGLWLDLLFDGAHQAARVGVLAGGALLAADGRLSVGAVLSALLLVEALIPPTLAIVRTALVLLSSAPYMERVSAAVDGVVPDPEPVPVAPAVRRVATDHPAIAVRDAWYRYDPEAAWTIADQTLLVRCGEVARLDGPSGSGKTTLLRLIAGLARPERGSVSVLGMDARDGRRQVLYLPQSFQLFGGTIAESLALLSQADPARLSEAAERTGLAGWLRALPMGADTPLPPGAGTLSGGQRQLLALTAAVASNRPVVLLDETMANMDPALRDRLDGRGLFAGRTVVLVEHPSSLALPG